MKKSKFLIFISALLFAPLLASCNLSPSARSHTISFVYDDSGVEKTLQTITTKGREDITLPTESPLSDYVIEGWFLDKGTWKQRFSEYAYSSKDLTEDIKVYAKLSLYNASIGKGASTSSDFTLKHMIEDKYDIIWAPSSMTYEQLNISFTVEDPTVLSYSVSDTTTKHRTYITLTGLKANSTTNLVMNIGNKQKTYPVTVTDSLVTVEFYITNTRTSSSSFTSARKVGEYVTCYEKEFKIKLPTVTEEFFDPTYTDESSFLSAWYFPWTSTDPTRKEATEETVFKTDTKLYADWEQFNINNMTPTDSAASRTSVKQLNARAQAIVIRYNGKYRGIEGVDALKYSYNSLQYFKVVANPNVNLYFDTDLAKSPFVGCNKLTTVVAPLYLAGLMNKTALKTFKQVGTMTYVGTGSFDGYENLETITLTTNVTEIKDEAIRNCANLTSIIIDGDVKVSKVGRGNFTNCPNLNVTKEGGLTYLPLGDNDYHILFDSAIENTAITIKLGTYTIADHTFINGENITSIIYEGTMSKWETMDKGQYWATGLLKNVIGSIHCSDGDFPL